MSQENNLRVGEAPMSPEEAFAFLSRCDDYIRSVMIPLKRAVVARIAYGDAEGFATAQKACMAAMVQGNSTIAALDALARSTDEPLYHWARMIRRYLTTPEEHGLNEKINRTLRRWRSTRAHFDSPELDVHGAWALMNAMMTEEDSEKRRTLFVAFHARDEQLAEMMIALRDQRNAFARQKGYPDHFTYKCIDSGCSSDITTLFTDAEVWFRALNSLPVTSAQDRQMAEHILGGFDPQEVTRQLAEKLGLEDAYSRITIDTTLKGGEVPRCIEIDPPAEVAVIAPADGKDVWARSTFFQEMGHAFHYTSIARDLPYVFRVPMGELPWREAMDALMTRLTSEYIQTVPGNGDGPSKRTLALVWDTDTVESLKGVLLRFFFNAYFYTTDEHDPHKIGQQWVEIKQRLYGEDFPLLRGGDTPKGHTGYVAEWANDHWITENPADLKHLFGEMIAAQLRAYWKKSRKPLLSREFGEWLRKTCWEPGFSKPWRELLREATGEDLNPQYFLDELEELKRRALA